VWALPQWWQKCNAVVAPATVAADQQLLLPLLLPRTVAVAPLLVLSQQQQRSVQ
jgi:hypothetical protein